MFPSFSLTFFTNTLLDVQNRVCADNTINVKGNATTMLLRQILHLSLIGLTTVASTNLTACCQEDRLGLVAIRGKLVSKDNGEAIDGAWQRATIGMMADAVEHLSTAGRPMSKYESIRFLAFVEGRLGVSIPQAFDDNIRNSYFLVHGGFWFPDQEFSAWKNNWEPGPLGPEQGTPMQFEVIENEIHLRRDSADLMTLGRSGRVTIPAELSGEIQKTKLTDDGVPSISDVVFTDDLVFVAVTSTDVPGGVLYCFDNRNTRRGRPEPSQLLWSKQFTQYHSGVYVGQNSWFTELRVSDSSVVLFHVCRDAIGIEGIDFEGNRLYEFSTQGEPAN